jgi:hypothetical protein
MDDKDRQLQALGERVQELERQGETLKRKIEARLAKLTPQQRARVEAGWAEHDPDQPLQ